MSNITTPQMTDEAKRIADCRESLSQYEEGAITFLESIFYQMTKVTQKDVDEFNEFHPDGQQLTLEMFR